MKTPPPSLFQIRLRAPHTASDAQWAETFRALSDNRDSCDEVWFSTGISFPPMEWHREHTARLAKYADELRRAGIEPSLQFQATLGHGDSFGGTPEEMAGRTWSGFTGPTGVECKACNCPRQPAVLAYVREMARLYAEAIQPAWLWIDDDLRVNNHLPAARWEDIGCWCETCRAAFAAETGCTVSAADAGGAGGSPRPLPSAWERFSFESIAAVARAIAEETHAVSPETRFGYQHGGWPNDSQLAVFRALREAGGRPVGSRPGGGAYYDLDPSGPVIKALAAARQRRVLGDPPWIDTWLPEIETYPRAFASRTPRGILLEAVASLAYGMNGLSALIMDTRYETDAWYSENLLAPLAAERAFLERYRDANLDTVPAGLDVPADMPIDDAWQRALAGVPVVPGPGIAVPEDGGLETASPPADASQGGGGLQSAVFPPSFRVSSCSTRDLARIRAAADAAAGGRLPVIVETPTVGLVVPRVAPDGALRTVLLLNARIDAQKPLTLRLRTGGAGGPHASAVWRAIGEPPVTFPVLREGVDARVTIPPLQPWSAGWLAL